MSKKDDVIDRALKHVPTEILREMAELQVDERENRRYEIARTMLPAIYPLRGAPLAGESEPGGGVSFARMAVTAIALADALLDALEPK